MKLNSLLILVAVLAALSAVAYWANRPAPEAAEDARVNQSLVDQATVEKAAKLRLTDQGKTVILARQSDGSWRDESYYGLPADFSKLSSFVGDLTAAKLQRLVTANPQRIARLEFAGTKIELLDASDHPLWGVDLGKTADQGGRFVRFGAEPKAYLASLSAWIDSDPKNWADATLLTLKSDDIAQVAIPVDGGTTVTATRAKKEDPWKAAAQPAGKVLKADKIASVLTSLTALRFSESSDLSDPQAVVAKEHLRTYRLTTFDGKSYTIAFGRKPEEKKLKTPDKKLDMSFKPGDEKKAPEPGAKPPTPEYDTIPAGPVFVWITASDPKAPVTALMGKRLFQVDDYTFTGLPQKADDLFDAAPPAVTK